MGSWENGSSGEGGPLSSVALLVDWRRFKHVARLECGLRDPFSMDRQQLLLQVSHTLNYYFI